MSCCQNAQRKLGLIRGNSAPCHAPIPTFFGIYTAARYFMKVVYVWRFSVSITSALGRGSGCCVLSLSNTFKNRTLKSYTLLVHIFGFVHPTRTKIPPFDSAFQSLYSARTFVNLQCNANALKCFIVLFIVFLILSRIP